MMDYRLREEFGDAGGVSVIRFELYEALEVGSSALAKIVTYNQKTLAYEASTATITVHGGTSKLSGKAGARGVAIRYGDSHRWEVLDLYPRRLFYWAILNEALTHGASAEAAIQIQAGDGTLSPTGATKDVWCPLVKADEQLPSGTIVKIEQDQDSDLWNATAVNECTEPIPEP